MLYQEFAIDVSDGKNAYQAKLTAYLPEAVAGTNLERPRPAVLICPGGGYALVSRREGEPVALQLLAMGFPAFVLEYSVAPVRYPAALLELAQSLRLIRTHAEAWLIDPDKLVVAGFSAGGHLAASLGVSWNSNFLENLLNCGQTEIRPDGLILSYPVITAGEFAHKGSFCNLYGDSPCDGLPVPASIEQQVTGDFPPVFLWHTYDDDRVPVENSLLLASALRQHNIPLELHIYPHGVHGLSLADWNTAHKEGYDCQPECANWITMAGSWIGRL